jgi:hypothetical protein
MELPMKTDDERKQTNWQLPLYTAAGTIVIFVLGALADSDGVLYF